MDLKKQDYKLMLKDIKEYIIKEKDYVCSGESERIDKVSEEIERKIQKLFKDFKIDRS